MRRALSAPPRLRPRLSQCIRTIYVPTHTTQNSSRRHAAGAATRLNQEAAQLDAQLRELRSRERQIQQSIKEQRDAEKQKELAQRDGAALAGRASPEELAALEESVQRPPATPLLARKAPKTPLQLLPKALRVHFDTQQSSRHVQLLQPKALSWAQVVDELARVPDLASAMAAVPQPEIDKLVVSVPLKQRAQLVPQLERMIPEHRQSQFVRDSFMAAYAERSEPAAVERLFAASPTPTVFSYGHLAKAHFKVRAPPETVLDIIRRMTAAGHSPNLMVYSAAVQSLIQHKRYTEAEGVFDNLKYLSVSTQPDTKLYNAMMLAASKQHNVNRVLDLYAEMKTRRPFPLQPSAETYSILIYACARDEKTHVMAWETFMEALSRGHEANRDSFRALLYLCGATGEAMLARALVRRLFERSGAAEHIVDEFVLNSLFLAYKNWRPGPSKILSTPTGQAIRAHILMDSAAVPLAPSLPLLPVSQLDEKLVLAESNAVLEFCADTRPQALLVQNRASSAALQRSPALFNCLQVVIQHNGGSAEFKRRFKRFTVLERDSKILHSEPLDTHANLAVARDQDLYRLAIRACTKFRDLAFAREIWTERGEWRKTAAFRELPQARRNALDFQFARDIVEVLAACGQVEEAQLVLKSAARLGAWRKHHVLGLLGVLERLEDTRGIADVYKVLNSGRAGRAGRRSEEDMTTA